MIHNTLTTEEAKLITHHAKPAETTDYYIFFSRKNANAKVWADKFDSGLKKLKASGAYDKIYAK